MLLSFGRIHHLDKKDFELKDYNLVLNLVNTIYMFSSFENNVYKKSLTQKAKRATIEIIKLLKDDVIIDCETQGQTYTKDEAIKLIESYKTDIDKTWDELELAIMNSLNDEDDQKTLIHEYKAIYDWFNENYDQYDLLLKIRDRIKILTQCETDTNTLLLLLTKFIQRLDLSNTENKDAKYDLEQHEAIFSNDYEKTIKCQICGKAIQFGESFTSYYANRGPFGLCICKDCYDIDQELRSYVERLIGGKNKMKVNDLISQLINENNSSNRNEKHHE